ncbi:glycosyltransferase family 2 protein [Povalibacter sp.]|uniref:glycosyltransferase family 2 protein n=1 Tax=Povalibacter sp. TaxID=1962978 RepID=UPI002F403120
MNIVSDGILVSVYMPTKDRRELVQAAVDSVLAQTHRPIELIVVDDGSTDATRAYLDELAATHDFVRVIHHDQAMGAPRSRNEAIRLARGEWITGLDDDDEFEPQRIEALLHFALLLERMGIAFSAVYSQYNTVRDGKVVPTAKRGSVGLDDLFIGNHVGNQIFARKQVFIDAGLFDESLPAWQDLDLIMRVVQTCGPARIFDAPLYRFQDDERDDRISRKLKTRILDAYRHVVAKYPQASPAAKRALYCQVFGNHYGFPVEWSDFRFYVALGASPLEMARLLLTGWRRRRARARR